MGYSTEILAASQEKLEQILGHFKLALAIVYRFSISREAAKECSPRRKPWVKEEMRGSSPEGAKKKSSHRLGCVGKAEWTREIKRAGRGSVRVDRARIGNRKLTVGPPQLELSAIPLQSASW